MTLPHARAEQLHDKGEMLMLLDDYAQILTQTIEQIRTTQRKKFFPRRGSRRIPWAAAG